MFRSCLRNVLSMFHVIEKEIAWRKSKGLPEGFDLLKQKKKPVVAVGAREPLGGQTLMADYFRTETYLLTQAFFWPRSGEKSR